MAKEKEVSAQTVTSAVLQAPITLGGKTEATLTAQKIPGIAMTWIKGEGLLVTHGGKHFVIPSTNVKIATIVPVAD